MEILSTAKISVPMLEALVQGCADFQPNWSLVVGTERFTLKFTTVHVFILKCWNEVKWWRNTSNYCDWKILKIVRKLKFQGSLITPKITMIISYAYSSCRNRGSSARTVTRLRAARPRIRSPVEAREFSHLQNVQIGTGAHTAPYLTCTVVLSGR
jgi:hypothetical protein